MDWDLDESGNIRLCPLMGYDSAVAAESACILSLTFARSENALKTGGERLQLVLTPQQALELSVALQQMAATTSSKETVGAPN